MKTYELTYIISPEITSEEAEAFSREMEDFVSKKEGIVLNKSIPVARTLSYPIKKHMSGFIGTLEFQLEAEYLSELKETLNKDVKINRHIIIAKNPVKIRKIRGKKNRDAGATKEIPVENNVQEKNVAEETVIPSKKVELKDIEQKLEEILGE
jgi:ribosomal protein S6